MCDSTFSAASLLYRALYVVVLFEINQHMDCVLIGELVSQMLTMLIDSPDKIVGDANVQRPPILLVRI